MKRISASLPDELVENLDALAERLGFSRSALIGVLLDDPVTSILQMLGDIPLNPTDGEMRRWRGESAAFLEATIKEVMAEVEQFKAGEGQS